MNPNSPSYRSGSSHPVQQPTVRRNAQRQYQPSKRVPNSADASASVYNGLDIKNNMIKSIDFNKIQVREVLEYLQHNPNVSIDRRVCIALLQKIGKLKNKITINLAVIDRIINQLPDNFTNMHIGNAMYGLQKLDGTNAATKRLVQALAEKVANSNAVLNAQHIGNAMYGLQNLDGTDAATKRLVQALAQKVANSKAVLNAQAIGNAMYGLQNLDDADDATQYLIKQIMKKTIDSGFINLDKKDMFIKHYSEKNRIDSVIIEFLIAVATSKKLLSLEPTDKVLCISEILHGMTYFCKNEDKAYEGFQYFIRHKNTTGNPIQQTIPFNPYQNPWKLDLHGYIPITAKFAIRYCLESVTINGKKFDEDNDVRTLQIITGQGNHSKRVYSILHQELMDYLSTNYQKYTISSEHGRIYLTK